MLKRIARIFTKSHTGLKPHEGKSIITIVIFGGQAPLMVTMVDSELQCEEHSPNSVCQKEGASKCLKWVQVS